MSDQPQPGPPQSNEGVAAEVRVTESFDDMHDSAAEISRYAPIAGTLELCKRIAAEFDQADGYAIRYQAWHRGLTRGAALFGTMAVLFSIIGLSRGQHPQWAAAWLESDKFDWAEGTLA